MNYNTNVLVMEINPFFRVFNKLQTDPKYEKFRFEL
jgi:hypothetical protein